MGKKLTLTVLLVFIFFLCLAGNGVYAFGAGNIPSYAYMEGRAFRHGDIEDTLSDLAKRAGGGAVFAIASALGKGGSKFHGLDIKRVYFGNWLRDYSQAVDIASLKKLQLQTIINLCMALGFLAHGYATREFEVTPERLGTYLPVEHIDNPKGYGDGEDARKYHPQLRGPVDPRELEVDPRTGMKNYIANEYGGWDTSKAHVRRTIEKCVHFGRMHRANGRKEDEYEAYRLLGTLLHTLEDFPAHSNFCELALISMGYNEVFSHVGDQFKIQAPNGKWVAPVVTGTFGSSDFIHSLLGEATDHLSEASVTDLNKEIEKARSTSARSGPGGGPADSLRQLFLSLPDGVGGEMSRDMEGVERIRAGQTQGGKRPEEMSPQELHSVLWQVLSFRDSVAKKISKTIERIPGLGPLIEKLMDSISVFVFTTLEPFLKPILQSATSGLQSASSEVIDTHDQYEVFNDPRASDPTHSFLSKDHFNLILNEPAGNLAKLILVNTVNLVIKAWDDSSVNAHHLAEEVTSCFFHPDFYTGNSKIQGEMLQYMRDWVNKLGGKQHDTLKRLSKNAVRNHENIRLAGDGGAPASQGSYATNQGIQAQHKIEGYLHQIPGVSQATSVLNTFGGGGGHGRRDGQGGEAASYYGGNSDATPSYPNPGSSYAPPSGPPPSSYAAPSAPPQSSYAPPPGHGPSFPASPGGPPHHSSYGPPSGPAFPGGPGQHMHEPPSHGGYAPSYASPPPPSFPGAPAPGYGGGFGGDSTPYGAPGSGPSFPSSQPNNPPNFPEAPGYGSGNQYQYGGQGQGW